MKLTRRHFTAGLAAGITAPYIIGSARAQGGATVKIGMCVPVTGPAAEQGLWAQNGAKLALAAVNKAGGVLGKQVALVIEDGLPYRTAAWSLWRAHRVFVPYATIQNWVEAGGGKGGAAGTGRAPRLGTLRLLGLHRGRRAV